MTSVTSTTSSTTTSTSSSSSTSSSGSSVTTSGTSTTTSVDWDSLIASAVNAKLAAATALWLGFDHLMEYLLYASIFGGILTLAMIRFRLMPLPDAIARQDWVKRLHKLDGGVPYGIALAAAALLIYPETTWMKLIQ